MMQNSYLMEVIEKDNRKRREKEAENARNLSLIAGNEAGKKRAKLVLLEKLAKVQGRISAAVKPLRWSFR
jgi:hypothetical protein